MTAAEFEELCTPTADQLECGPLRALLLRKRTVWYAALFELVSLEDAYAATLEIDERLRLAVYKLCVRKLFEPDSTPLGWQKRAQLFVKAAEAAGLSDLIAGEDGR